MYPYRVPLLRWTQIDNGSADGRILQRQMYLGSAVSVIRKEDNAKGSGKEMWHSRWHWSTDYGAALESCSSEIERVKFKCRPLSNEIWRNWSKADGGHCAAKPDGVVQGQRYQKELPKTKTKKKEQTNRNCSYKSTKNKEMLHNKSISTVCEGDSDRQWGDRV